MDYDVVCNNQACDDLQDRLERINEDDRNGQDTQQQATTPVLIFKRSYVHLSSKLCVTKVNNFYNKYIKMLMRKKTTVTEYKIEGVCGINP